MRVGSLAVVVAALGIVCAAEAAGQTSGPCRVFLNGVEASGADSPERAIRVDAREKLTIEGGGFEAPSPVKVELDFGPFKRTVFEHQVESAETWRTTIDVRDYARYGVGLYHVIATSDKCRFDAWVRVVGRSPFRTVVGIAAIALLVLGLVLVAVGLAVGAPLLIGIAAAGVGLGALLLGQQIGILPLTTANAILFVVGAPVVVAVVKLLTSGLARRAPIPVARKHEPLFRRLPEGIRKYKGVPGPSVERPPGDAMRLPGPSVEGPVVSAPLPSPPAASTRTESPDEITAGGARDRAYSYDEYGGEPAATPASLPSPPAASTRLEPRDEVSGGSREREPLSSYDSYEAEPAADLEEEPTVASEATPSATRIENLPAIRTDDSHPILMVKLPPDPERDPPRSAFALLECPEAVVAEREFDLMVGLAPKPTAGVVSARIARPEWSVGPYTLTTQLVAEGFALRADESWRQDMRVTADEPYPAITLHLTPEAQEAGIHARIISAHYSVDGQVIGVAYRSIAVARDDELLAEASVEPQEAGVDLSVPTDRVPADLTLMIQRSKLAKGRLLWNLQTAFKDIRVPEKALPVEVGDEPEAFARQLANQVNLREGRAGIYPLLLGVARTIAGPIPDEFWEVLTKVSARARAQSRAVTVLILSEEPYIPWELAAVEPPIDPDAPPFLGAQANVGRWVLAKKGPKLPPPAQVNVGPMAVVFGVYKTPWQRLLEAEDEAAKLKDTYGAVGVDATIDPVLSCISGTPEADILHFAVHGMYDADAALLDGLILVDGNPVAPLQVKGSALRRGPFVFLNACQVGRGNRILGDYAGMAEAFLFAGAAALVAPLWSVKDDVAKRIALDFYEKTFAGATPADVLRRERAKFKPSLGPEFATYLAYQFFGHPTMKLTRRN